MKITKENFDKLKQLDRIEFRQRKDIIDKGSGSTYRPMMDMIIVTLICFGLLATMSLELKHNGNLELSKSTTGFAFLIYFVGFFTVFIIAIIGIIQSVIRKYQLTKLEQEYFTEEIKIKK